MKIWGKMLVGVVMLLSHQTWAQSTSETALLFSRTKPGGSARVLAMGGVQTSLGGDLSSTFSNPAGLGMYNRSEFVISPGFQSASVTSNYLNNSTTETKTNLNIPSFGVIFQTDQDGRNGFLSGTFGISFTRTNNFNQNLLYQGMNNKNSIIDYFIEDAKGFDPNSFLSDGDNFNTPTGLAYNNYLIEDSTFFSPDASRFDYLSVMGTFPGNINDVREVLQAEDIKTTGAQNQWSFSYGANLNDKVFLGVGIGFTALRFQTKKTYRESDYKFLLDEDFNPLDNMTLEENLNISGSGVNGTLGIIFRPLDHVQLGVSYTTPTIYKLTDSYSAVLSTDWNNFDYFQNGDLLDKVSEQTEEILTEYDLRTPSHLNVGGTYFFGKSGFISADAEVVNYAGAKYNSGISGISFNSDNERIRELYQTTVNLRSGGEYRFKNYRVRAGIAYLPDPFRDEQNGIDREIMTYSAGAGYKSEKFYIDFAWVLSSGQTSYRPYRVNSEFSPLVTIKNNTTLAVVTLGFPF